VALTTVSEEVLRSLLDDDALVSESEERVLKGVVRWMKGGGGVTRGEGLLQKIRFPQAIMSAVFLRDEARALRLPENSVLEGLALEAAGLNARQELAS
jgi:hypothetical protein